MTLELGLIALLAAGLALAWRLRPGRRRSAAVPPPPPVLHTLPRVERPRGHMLTACVECCRAARRIESDWYPQAQAPPLPLAGCEHPERCACRWMCVLDRRVTRRPVADERRHTARAREVSGGAAAS